MNGVLKKNGWYFWNLFVSQAGCCVYARYVTANCNCPLGWVNFCEIHCVWAGFSVESQNLFVMWKPVHSNETCRRLSAIELECLLPYHLLISTQYMNTPLHDKGMGWLGLSVFPRCTWVSLCWEAIRLDSAREASPMWRQPVDPWLLLVVCQALGVVLLGGVGPWVAAGALRLCDGSRATSFHGGVPSQGPGWRLWCVYIEFWPKFNGAEVLMLAVGGWPALSGAMLCVVRVVYGYGGRGLMHWGKMFGFTHLHIYWHSLPTYVKTFVRDVI